MKPWVLSKIERGLRRAKPELVKKLAKALYASPVDLQILWLSDKILDTFNGDSSGPESLILARTVLLGAHKEDR